MATGDILYALGFENGTDSAGLEHQFTTTGGGTCEMSSAQAKSGSYSYKMVRAASTTSSPSISWFPTSTAYPALYNKSSLTMTFWVYFATFPPLEHGVAFIGPDTVSYADYAHITVTSAGTLGVRFGSSGSYASLGSVSTGAWNQVTFTATYADTTFRAKARLNEGTTYEVTRSGSAATIIEEFGMGAPNNSWSGTGGTQMEAYFDDIVFYEGYTIPSGLHTLKVIRPTGDVSGTYSITGGDPTRYQALDDVPVSTASYISSATANDVQVLDFGTYSLGANQQFRAFQVQGTTGGSSATGARTLTAVLQHSNGTDYPTTSTWNCQKAAGTWSRGSAYPAPIHTVIRGSGGGIITQADVDGVRLKLTKSNDSNEVRVADVYMYAVVRDLVITVSTKSLTATLSFTGVTRRFMRKTYSAALSFTSAQSRKAVTEIAKVLTATLSFTTSFPARKFKKGFSAVLSFTTGSLSDWWRFRQDTGGWYVKRGGLRRRKPY